jgi:hypothetical protein
LLSGRGFAGPLVGALLCVVLFRTLPGIVGLEPKVDALPQSYVGVLLDPAARRRWSRARAARGAC